MKVSLPAISALVALALLGATSAGCRDTTTTARADSPAAAPQPLAVAVASAREQTLMRMTEVQGALFPKEMTVISAEVAGPIAQIQADFGDAVDAGQPLLRIDSREYKLRADSAEAAYRQAMARLGNVRADFGRARELHNEQMMSNAQFDQISANLKVAEADTAAAEKALGLAQKKLADTVVRAPFRGFVQKRLVSLGAYVNSGDKIYELIATDPMKLRTTIPERIVPLAHIGLEVSLTVDAAPGKTYTGKITRMAPALDEATRTLLVEAEVPNPSGVLRSGYFAHVKVSLGEGRGLFVPQSAVLRYAGVERVFVIEGGVAHSREVTTGALLGDEVEIVKGLMLGEKVAVSDTDRLADGVAVSMRGAS